jgi:hypothetical protein
MAETVGLTSNARFNEETGLREDFIIPISEFTGRPISYFEGHSLGL